MDVFCVDTAKNVNYNIYRVESGPNALKQLNVLSCIKIYKQRLWIIMSKNKKNKTVPQKKNNSSSNNTVSKKNNSSSVNAVSGKTDNSSSVNSVSGKTDNSSSGNAVSGNKDNNVNKSTVKGKKESDRIRFILTLVLSFLVPVVIYFIVLKRLSFYPFGDKTLLIMDLKGEYTEYMASLRYIFNSDNSLFFSWSRSMGGNVLGVYAFYAGGITPFLTCLFKVSQIYKAIYFITLFKIGLCGLSFALYLEFAFNKKAGRFADIIFATSYALMSYNIVYSMQLMWLDGVILMPIVFLGIEQILKGKKGLLFYLSVVTLIITNYYTAYVVCIFSVFYVIFRWAGSLKKENKPELIKALLRYAGNAVLAVMTAAPFLLAVYLDLKEGKLSQAAETSSLKTNFEFLSVFKKLLCGQYDSITNTNAYPAIYCGIIMLALFAVFLIQKKQLIREKIIAVLIFAMLLVSFWNVQLDKAWHGFQFPHWFPYRYAFIFSFFLVFIAYRAYMNIKFSQKTEYFIIAAVMVVICVDLSTNTTAIVKGLDGEFGFMEKAEYDNFYSQTEPLVKQAKTDKSFYRMDKDFEFSKNDAMLLGYNGMTHYSSAYNNSINSLTPKFGLAQSWYWNSGYGATPLMDSIFAVKYRINQKITSPTYNALLTQGSSTLYENPDVLSIGFAASADCTNVSFDGDVFQNQNTLLSSLTGESKNYFNPVTYTKTNATGSFNLDFTATDTNPVYLYMDETGVGWGTISVNGNYVNNYYSTETTCSVYLGTFSAGENVTVTVQSDSVTSNQVWMYSLDTQAMQSSLSDLKKGNLNITKHGNGGSLKGTIELKDNQVIFTSIPYSDGYTVKVDGKKVTPGKYADTFMIIPASAGKHTVSIAYSVPGIKKGMIPACLAIVIAIGVYVPAVRRKIKVF